MTQLHAALVGNHDTEQKRQQADDAQRPVPRLPQIAGDLRPADAPRVLQLTQPGRTDLADERNQADTVREPVNRLQTQLFEHRGALRPRYRPGLHPGAGNQLQQAGELR